MLCQLVGRALQHAGVLFASLDTEQRGNRYLHLGEELGVAFDAFAVAQEQSGLGILENVDHPGNMQAISRRIQRDRHGTGIQAAKKRGDVFRPGLTDDQHPLPCYRAFVLE
ncbi:hypothetical protein D3C85_677940 [compost metagenome]